MLYYKTNEEGKIVEVLHIENPPAETVAEYKSTDKEIVQNENGEFVIVE